MLCERCAPMFKRLDEIYRGLHHSDLASFQAAAAAGCYICEPMLHSTLKKTGALENCLAERFTCSVFRQKDDTTTVVCIDLSILVNGNKERDRWDFVVYPTSFFPTDRELRIRHRMSTIPPSVPIPRVQNWMSTCLNGHDKCKKNTNPTTYPSRLLELTDTSFRLIRPDESFSNSYAALSYCWGPNPNFLRLTASNQGELQTGIGLASLPLAFQEAVNFLKSLSIRYLWIDSLCIIQSGEGSIMDWQSESSRMHGVYSNSILTLALARSASPHESCFTGGSFLDVIPPFDIETNNMVTRVVLHTQYPQDAVYKQPLGRRAWALQERLMAERTVNFGHGELFWDCKQLTIASESLPHGLLVASTKFSFYNGPVQNPFNVVEKFIPSTKDPKILSATWWGILTEYSQRELTQPTDRLIALSAVAKSMGEAMDDVYIVGHFWKMLPQSLEWIVKPSGHLGYITRATQKVDKITTIRGEVKDYNVPSWSWASMGGPIVRHRMLSGQPIADVESYLIRGSDFASLTIRAYCTEIELSDKGSGVFLPPSYLFSDQLQWDISLDEKGMLGENIVNASLAALSTIGPTESWGGLILERTEQGGEVRHMRMGHWRVRVSPPSDEHKPYTWPKIRRSLFGQVKKRLILI